MNSRIILLSIILLVAPATPLLFSMQHSPSADQTQQIAEKQNARSRASMNSTGKQCEKTYRCTHMCPGAGTCTHTYSTREEFAQHLQEHAQQEKIFFCRPCLRLFPTQAGLRIHENAHQKAANKKRTSPLPATPEQPRVPQPQPAPAPQPAPMQSQSGIRPIAAPRPAPQPAPASDKPMSEGAGSADRFISIAHAFGTGPAHGSMKPPYRSIGEAAGAGTESPAKRARMNDEQAETHEGRGADEKSCPFCNPSIFMSLIQEHMKNHKQKGSTTQSTEMFVDNAIQYSELEKAKAEADTLKAALDRLTAAEKVNAQQLAQAQARATELEKTYAEKLALLKQKDAEKLAQEQANAVAVEKARVESDKQFLKEKLAQAQARVAELEKEKAESDKLKTELNRLTAAEKTNKQKLAQAQARAAELEKTYTERLAIVQKEDAEKSAQAQAARAALEKARIESDERAKAELDRLAAAEEATAEKLAQAQERIIELEKDYAETLALYQKTAEELAQVQAHATALEKAATQEAFLDAILTSPLPQDPIASQAPKIASASMPSRPRAASSQPAPAPAAQQMPTSPQGFTFFASVPENKY